MILNPWCENNKKIKDINSSHKTESRCEHSDGWGREGESTAHHELWEAFIDMQVKETYSLGTYRDSGLRKDKCDGGRGDSTWGRIEGHYVE